VRVRPRLLTPLAFLALGVSANFGMLACGDPSTEEIVEGKPWLVTVYYTAVESFHEGPHVEVTGCTVSECDGGNDSLGRYPHGFVEAVRVEGSGRITSGANAGKYLNWSYDIGYWLDTAPRNAHGGELEPFRSAAADEIPDGTRLRLADCGRFDSGDEVQPDVCEALRNGKWEVQDRFTPGLGGPQHIDLYIGEESEPDFTKVGALYVSLHGASFTVAS
jgi:hypothetical protein